MLKFVFFSEMDRPLWNNQCEKCGKRFPTVAKLRKHINHMHGGRIYCTDCTFSCSSYDRYRLRQHIRDKHIPKQLLRNFEPAETPRLEREVQSVVVQPKMSEEIIREAMDLLDQQMPDFAEMFASPRTPSPMRQLYESDHFVATPSEELFQKYLSTEPSKKEPGAYSPSDKPFLHVSLSQPTTPTSQPLPITPMNLTTVASPEKLNTEPSEPSLILPAHAPQPQTVIPKYTEPTPAHTIKPSSTLLDFRPSITTTDTAPLDLTTRPKQPVNIPLEPLTPVIDCTRPTNQWTINTFDTDNTSDKAYQHYCLDPRVFFAGAPSSYLTHPLAKTLQEKANLSRRCQKSRYQR